MYSGGSEEYGEQKKIFPQQAFVGANNSAP
jgi:hypothetical protein